MADNHTRDDYLADPKVAKTFWTVFWAILILLLIAGALFGHHEAPADGAPKTQSLTDIFGFYAWFGFFAAAGTIAVSKVFKAIFKRKDDYYDG